MDGIIVGHPVRANAVWSLPIQAGVSGLETFTSKHTVLNSGLVCSSVAAKIIDHFRLNSGIRARTSITLRRMGPSGSQATPVYHTAYFKLSSPRRAKVECAGACRLTSPSRSRSAIDTQAAEEPEHEKDEQYQAQSASKPSSTKSAG